MQQAKYKFSRSRSAGQNGGGCFDSPRLNDSDAVFAFNQNRPTNSVSVENIPDHGEVRNYQDIRDGPTPRLDITFHDRDTATKALCMNGYTVSGVPLAVSALSLSLPVTRANKSTADDRRNLYVLGIPFALNKNEFASLFAQYGTVSHCVILATVDNSSRRRGFVVMSSHEEARLAMSALTKTQIKGHTIDVSWAVVQRSQGFLDGGDRAMLLDSRSHLPSPSPKLHDRNSLTSSDTSDSSLGSHDADPTSLTTCSLPTPSLLVSNLPTLLFSQAQDLHPLFFPFGHIEKLEIVQVSPLGTMSVVVQYSTPYAAQEAKDSLNGQLYGNSLLEARFVISGKSPVMNSAQTFGTSSLPGSRMNTPDVLHRSDYFIKNRGSLDSYNSLGTIGPIRKSASIPSYGSRTSGWPSTNYDLLANPQTRQSPLSAHPTFSNLFNDFDSPPASSSSRWSADRTYGMSVVDHQRPFTARSSPIQFNTAYQSSAA